MTDECVVDLSVSDGLLAEFEDYKHLLGGREISREPGPHGVTVLKMAMPDAPEGAATMSPWFTRHDDGVALSGIEYYAADGIRIN